MEPFAKAVERESDYLPSIDSFVESLLEAQDNERTTRPRALAHFALNFLRRSIEFDVKFHHLFERKISSSARLYSTQHAKVQESPPAPTPPISASAELGVNSAATPNRLKLHNSILRTSSPLRRKRARTKNMLLVK